MTQSLIQFCQEQLEARRGEWPQIATGADVTYSWLTKFAQGQIPSPGVKRVEQLATHLRSLKPLKRAS